MGDNGGMKEPITVTTAVRAPIERVWECWTGLEHLEHWSFASPEWGAKGLESDLRAGGRFRTEMFARDGSFAFVFEGTFTEVAPPTRLRFTLDDDRKVEVDFTASGETVEVVERFEAESMHSREMQQEGWQAFLDNFKAYVESAG